MCQCPERGDPHFYESRVPRPYRGIDYCVNALKGATLISTKVRRYLQLIQKRCQCPERGDPHFYGLREKLELVKDSCVNALKGATLISTGFFRRNKSSVKKSVNALKGATLISTLASGNPHK